MSLIGNGKPCIFLEKVLNNIQWRTFNILRYKLILFCYFAIQGTNEDTLDTLFHKKINEINEFCIIQDKYLPEVKVLCILFLVSNLFLHQI